MSEENKIPVDSGNKDKKIKKKKVNSRNKGHSAERKYVNLFKQMGYEFCKTTRNASRLLDSCKIDLAQLPFNIQIKKGYKNNRPKADEIFIEMKDLLSLNFPKEDNIHNYPKVLIHELDGYKSENTLVTMTWDDWKRIIDELNKLKNER